MKYHLGTSFNRPTSSGKMVHLSLMANPSHLEAVNTVVLGKTRAKQYFSGALGGVRGSGRWVLHALIAGRDTLEQEQLRPKPTESCL